MVRRVRPSSMATQTSAMTSSERTLSLFFILWFQTRLSRHIIKEERGGGENAHLQLFLKTRFTLCKQLLCVDQPPHSSPQPSFFKTKFKKEEKKNTNFCYDE